MQRFACEITTGSLTLDLVGLRSTVRNQNRCLRGDEKADLPAGRGRLSFRSSDAKHAEYIPKDVYAELKKFYFDIAHASFPRPLAALLKFAPENHILFGTDFSPEPMESTVNELPTSGLSAKLMAAIERGNTEKLFPRFKV